MKIISQRMIVYPKDVQRITGKSERYGRYLLKRIKERNAKADHQFVTVEEFSEYTGLSMEMVTGFIVD